MISPRDLCTLAEAKSFFGSRAPSATDDPLLQRFIGRASTWLPEHLSRSLAAQSYTERRNGTGTGQIFCRNYPVISIGALWIGNCQVQAAAANASGISLGGNGFVSDERIIYLRCREFPRGTQNVLIQYQAGFITPGTLALAQLQPWQAEFSYGQGVQVVPPGASFVFRALGPGKSGSTQPVWPAQQSATVTDGNLTWIAVEPYAGIITGAAFLPEEIKVAAMELVVLQYRNKDRAGDTGVGVGPERVNYFMKAMHPMTKESLEPFKDVVPPYELMP